MSTRTRHAVTHTPPSSFRGFSEESPLDLPPLTERVEQQIRDLLISKDSDAWSEAAARVGNCTNPIRLRGHSDIIDTATGEIVSS